VGVIGGGLGRCHQWQQQPQQKSRQSCRADGLIHGCLPPPTLVVCQQWTCLVHCHGGCYARCICSVIHPGAFRLVGNTRPARSPVKSKSQLLGNVLVGIEPVPQLPYEHAVIFRVVDGYGDHMHPACGECILQGPRDELCRPPQLLSRARHTPAHNFTKSGLPNVMPKSGIGRPPAPTDHPIGTVLEDQYNQFKSSLMAVSNFLAVHHEAAVAADGMTRRSGTTSQPPSPMAGPPPSWPTRCRATMCWRAAFDNFGRTRSYTCRCPALRCHRLA